MNARTAGLLILTLAALLLGGCGLTVDRRWADAGPDDDPPVIEQDKQLASLVERATADPRSAEARRALADGLIERHALREGLIVWAQLLSEAPADEELAMGLLRAVQLLGVPEPDIEGLCRQVLERDEDNQGALWVLGQLFVSQNQMRQARLFLSRAWEADPTYWRAALALARVAGFQLQLGEARTWCARAEGSAPRTSEAQAQLADAYLQAGDLGKALALADAASALGPRYPEPLTIRAKVLLAAGRTEGAIAAIKRALELTPEGASVANPLVTQELARRRQERHWLLGEAYLAAAAGAPGSDAETTGATSAREEFQKALDETDAGDPPPGLLYQMAMACQTLGDAQKAIEYYQKVMDRDIGDAPTLTRALNNYAYLCAEGGHHLDEALTAARTAADLTDLEHRPIMDDTLGWVLYQRGEYPEAIASLEEARKGAPEEPAVLFHLGMAYGQAGQATKGVGLLEQAARSPRADEDLKSTIAEHLPRMRDRARSESQRG